MTRLTFEFNERPSGGTLLTVSESENAPTAQEKTQMRALSEAVKDLLVTAGATREAASLQ